MSRIVDREDLMIKIERVGEFNEQVIQVVGRHGQHRRPFKPIVDCQIASGVQFTLWDSSILLTDVGNHEGDALRILGQDESKFLACAATILFKTKLEIAWSFARSLILTSVFFEVKRNPRNDSLTKTLGVTVELVVVDEVSP